MGLIAHQIALSKLLQLRIMGFRVIRQSLYHMGILSLNTQGIVFLILGTLIVSLKFQITNQSKASHNLVKLTIMEFKLSK